MPVVKEWVRVMVPKIIPLPERVVVMIILFAPVNILPVVMFKVAAVASFNNVTVLVATDLFRVNTLKVVAPVIVALLAPVNCTVPDEGVKVPLFTQLRKMVWVNVPPANVVVREMVKVPFTEIFPAAVFVLPFDTIRLLYVIAFTFCAPVPLKFTVFGMVDVTFKEPELMVNTLAIPSTALADNCKLVPLIVVLYKLAVPDKTELPVNVAVPAFAEKVPDTSSRFEMEKLALVVMDPLICNVLNPIVPAPLIVLEVPGRIRVPVLAENVPDTDKFPLMVKDELVEIVPLTVRSFKIILVPEIDFVVPVMVIKPPDNCVNCPEPDVERFPDTFSVVPEAAVIPEERNEILLKF